ncbi:MAG TPA: response regulator transcription factor [Anaeromyxobacter sp.]|jgi:DNA-binding response OmpR family regulator|nr:response regulator transcription factor [Anaeromyxobacter sp.]
MVSVLVVDDENDIREAVAEVLSDEGYVVHGARDGAEALRTARAVHPSIVLLDLMMPGMNGWEFRAAQKDDPDIQDIPVVVLSALGRVSGMDAAGFIQKPFDLEELLSVIRAHAQEEPGSAQVEPSRHAAPM